MSEMAVVRVGEMGDFQAATLVDQCLWIKVLHLQVMLELVDKNNSHSLNAEQGKQ